MVSLQAIAIFIAVKRDLEVPLDVADYMKELSTKMIEVESKISRYVSS